MSCSHANSSYHTVQPIGTCFAAIRAPGLIITGVTFIVYNGTSSESCGADHKRSGVARGRRHHVGPLALAMDRSANWGHRRAEGMAVDEERAHRLTLSFPIGQVGLAWLSDIGLPFVVVPRRCKVIRGRPLPEWRSGTPSSVKLPAAPTIILSRWPCHRVKRMFARVSRLYELMRDDELEHFLEGLVASRCAASTAA